LKGKKGEMKGDKKGGRGGSRNQNYLYKKKLYRKVWICLPPLPPFYLIPKKI